MEKSKLKTTDLGGQVADFSVSSGDSCEAAFLTNKSLQSGPGPAAEAGGQKYEVSYQAFSELRKFNHENRQPTWSQLSRADHQRPEGENFRLFYPGDVHYFPEKGSKRDF